ncbi:hypothetical protein APV28_0716 [Comamonas testosteroni]|nr:hypothetical protein APV28_0716 [Comamonas testosteroni]
MFSRHVQPCGEPAIFPPLAQQCLARGVSRETWQPELRPRCLP